jgi:hypothetical protein
VAAAVRSQLSAGAASGRWVRRLVHAAVAVTAHQWKGDARAAVAMPRAEIGSAAKENAVQGTAAKRAVRRLDLAPVSPASVLPDLDHSQGAKASAVPVLVAGDLAPLVLVPALAVASVRALDRKDSVRREKGRPWNAATTMMTTMTAASADEPSGTKTKSSGW